MRSPRGIDRVVDQQQTGSFRILTGIKNDEAALAVVAGPGVLSGYGNRSPKLFLSIGHVKRMDALEVRARRRLAHGHHVDRAMRTDGAVNHRGGGDPDGRRDLSAAVRVGRRLSGLKQRNLP